MLLGSGIVKVSVSTSGASYAAAPVVSFSGGGGTGAAAVALMGGTKVDAVVITNAGTGYTSSPTVTLTAATTDMAGTGAAATATVIALGSTAPVSMFMGRFGDMYGVNGYGRGFRWNGTSPILESIGISKPLSAPVISSSTAASSGYVRSISIVNGGAGYYEAPTVTFSGGGLTDGHTGHAVARAKVMNARVIGMTVDQRGGQYSSTPTITLSGGLGGGATLHVGVSGKLESVDITAKGSGYTTAGSSAISPSLSGGGITGAQISVSLDNNGAVSSVSVLAAGTGATTTPTISLGGGVGSGATLTPRMTYTVTSVTCATTQAGTGYVVPPSVSFRPTDGGAVALASVTNGSIASPLEVTAGGAYQSPPTASIDNTAAKAIATLSSPMNGVYKCCIRYIDATPESARGPVPSSISTLTEVSVGPSTATFAWSWSNAGVESRVEKIELWRTTSDQSIVLYRVAVLPKVGGVLPTTYTDTLTDDDLLDPERTDFGLMPIVMPSGQLNARRFTPPPTYCAEAVMFQDRAWYSVDTTGAKPNSLWHSEIDEPESVPEEYEIVVQESGGDPDAIRALIPFNTMLLIAQARHTYKMQYVAQPVIDATITLALNRGILNGRCHAVLGEVVYIVDSYGMYAFDGSGQQAVSVAVDNYWQDDIIDFSKAKYFHVQADEFTRTVRFFYCRAGDGDIPVRALCYCAATRAWWEEVFAQPVGCSAKMSSSGKQVSLFGAGSGGFLKPSSVSMDATTSGSTSIPWDIQTGAMRLDNSPSRGVGILYKPTANAEELRLRMHYNGSTAPRQNAISSDRGSGFVTVGGSTEATLNMAVDRSALGQSPGYAFANYAGRFDDRSAGGDRHIAVGVAGLKATTAAVVISGLTITGAGD